METVSAVKAFHTCGPDKYSVRTSNIFSTAAHNAPLMLIHRDMYPNEPANANIWRAISRDTCKQLIAGEFTDPKEIERYKDKTVVVSWNDLMRSCDMNWYFGNPESMYLAFSRAGTAALVISDRADVPGLFSNIVSPYDHHRVAKAHAMPFISIGRGASGPLLRRLFRFAYEGRTEEIHALITYDENQYDYNYRTWIKLSLQFVVGPVAMLTIMKCVNVGMTPALTSRFLVVCLELPSAILCLWWVWRGAGFYEAGATGGEFLLVGYLFQWSGIASSLIVSFFWRAYSSEYQDLSNFVDPVIARPRAMVALVSVLASLDVIPPIILWMCNRDNVPTYIPYMRTFLVWPLFLLYITTIVFFFHSAVRVYRNLTNVKSVKSMSMYLIWHTFFLACTMASFIIVSLNLHYTSAFANGVCFFLYFLGRTGDSLCNASVFETSNGTKMSTRRSSAYIHPEAAGAEAVQAAGFLEMETTDLFEKLARRENELVDLKKDNEQKDKMIEREKNFIASALHEIRNPLNGIAMGIEYSFESLKDQLTPQVEQELRSIEKCSTHLQVLLKNVLSLDKILHGTMALPQEPFSPFDMLTSVEDMSRHSLRQGVSMSVQCGSVRLLSVLGAPMQLNLMLLNLVSNAAKFTESGSVILSANLLRDDASVSEIKFAVTDTGPGVPKDKQKSIFGMRSQTGDTASQSKGFGIGLSIASKLAQLMGGELTCRSPIADGKGSEFSFTLKLTKVEGVDKFSTLASGTAVKKRTDAPTNLRMLIVDDQIMNRKLMQRKFKSGVFKELKWEVETANTGEECLSMMQVKTFDFVVIDENMHEGGGILTGTETTVKIRALVGQRRVLIFGCTGNCTEEDKQKSVASGQDAFWEKPAPLAERALAEITRLWNDNYAGSPESTESRTSSTKSPPAVSPPSP